MSGSLSIWASDHFNPMLINASLPHTLRVNPDRNSEVWYLVKRMS